MSTYSPRVMRPLLVILLLCGGLQPGDAAAASSRRAPDVQHIRTNPSSSQAAAVELSRSTHRGNTSVAGAVGPPGVTVGNTYWDYQHHGSTGRQIDERDGVIQVVFAASDAPRADSGLVIRWNRVEVAGSPTLVTLDNGELISVLPLTGPVSGNGVSLPHEQSGFPTLAMWPGGRAVAFYHGKEHLDSSSRSVSAIDLSLGLGSFTSDFPPPGAALGHPVWPRGTASIACGDTAVHVVASVVPPELWYWRGTVSDGNIVWDLPTTMGSMGLPSAVVETHGDTVAVVYTRPTTIQWDWDVVYRLSADCGVSWSAPINITGYDATSPERAWADLDAVFDEDGVLHVIWNTIAFDTAAGLRRWSPNNLNHWNSQRQTVRLIEDCAWSNLLPEGCSAVPNTSQRANGMGKWNLPLAKMNLAVKPAGDGPGPGIADELLYAIWVQGGPTVSDCASWDSSTGAGGFVNTDLYCSVSSDDGLTWDRPQNITGTATPECPPGECHSEHWVTAAARADSGVYISYLDDTHAGGAAVGEGQWSLSPYRVMAMEARQPVPAPVISAWPTEFLELNTGTSGQGQIEVSVGNSGNAALDFTVTVMSDDGGDAHLSVNGGLSYSGTAAKAASPQTVTIQLDGTGLPDPSEYDWRIEITSNDSTNNPAVGGTPIDVHLNVFVADDWYTCTQDTISTGLHRLSIGSCLEVGDQAGGGGLYEYATGREWLYDASLLVARIDDTTKRVYRDMYWQNLADRGRTSNQGFRAQSAIDVSRDTLIVVGDTSVLADMATGTATSTDSLVQLDWLALAFKESYLAHGVVFRYVLTSRSSTALPGLHLGAAADWDVDSMFDANNGLADESSQYVGAEGGYRDGGGIVFSQSNYAALFLIPLDASCSDVGSGAQVLDNVDYVYPEDAYHSDSLYDVLARMTGWSSATLQADTASDLNVVMLAHQDVSLGPNDTIRFAMGIAVSDIDEGDLRVSIDALRSALNPSCGSCPIAITGDVNVSGSLTSADIIYLVNFVFKGDVPPEPCTAAADVDCSLSVTSADIIYLVNFVFKGGAAPCDVCTLIPEPWPCP